MSQFMICRSKNDLSELECKSLLEYSYNNDLLEEIIKLYFKKYSLSELWIFEEFDYYCTETGIFMNSHFYYLLSNIYDKSDEIIAWYSDYYENLNKFIKKEDFFKYVAESCSKPCCEVYAWIDKTDRSC